VPWAAGLKLRSMVPFTARVLGYLDPQWGRRGAPWLMPKLIDLWLALDHHECDNGVCKWSSYTYGAGKPTLWRHENLNAQTHDVWLSDEFGAVPLTFFTQIDACVKAGHLLSVDNLPELPRDFVAQPPRTDAHIAFLAGAQNQCFIADSQRASHEWYLRHVPGRSTLHIFDNYGHLDVFMGEHSDRDCFPTILDELARAPQPAATVS
jgi:hypothetical protein